MAAAPTLTDPVTRRRDRRPRDGRHGIAVTLGCGLAAWAHGALAQPVALDASDLQRRANRVLAVMAYSVVPDLTSSALSIQDTQTGSQGLSMLQAAGGYTPTRGRPLYLEGGLALSQYDPEFVVGADRQVQAAPAHWTGLSATGGIGWDFRLGPDLVWRPIVNVALGRVSSELKFPGLPGFRPDTKDTATYDFLGQGHLDAWGLGGSVMLDYERYRPDSEIDVELRYTAIRLRSYGSTAAVVQGQADAITASLWTRYRAPTGLVALERPLRYVLEYAHTNYLGDQAGILGFHYLNSVGVGLELDSSAHDIGVTRTRLMLRYVSGGEVSGYSIGLAVSF